jgi:hypothetical protein
VCKGRQTSRDDRMERSCPSVGSGLFRCRSGCAPGKGGLILNGSHLHGGRPMMISEKFFLSRLVPDSNKKLQERTGINVAAYLEEPMFAAVHAEPVAILSRWGVVDSPKVRFRVYRFGFVSGPRRGLD